MVSTAAADPATPPGRRGRSTSALVALPLALTALVYFPITANYFYADDFLNLFQIANDPVALYLTTPNGGHALVTRNAVWYVLAHVFGAQPVYYFWSVLLTHLLNVALLFAVIRCFTQSAELAAFGAALWGTSPFHEGTLGSYSVYGQVMVGTILLLIVYQAAQADVENRPRDRRLLWLWYGLALAAATSFGVGISLAMVLPFVVALLLPQWRRARWWLPLISLVVVIPVLYEVLLRLYAYFGGKMFSSAQMVRRFVLEHPWPVVWSLVQLPAYGTTRLLLGFFFPPWLPPWVWDVVLAAIVAAGVVVFRAAAPPVRRQLAACSLLVLSCYAIVAAGRGIALYRAAHDWFVAVTRYHYVALIPLTIIICILLSELARRWPIAPRTRGLFLTGWVAASLVGYVVAGPRIEHWDMSRTETAHALEAIRSAIAAAPPDEPVYIRNRPFPPAPPVIVPYAQFPGWAAVFVIFYPDAVVDGRRVYFMEPDAGTREAAQYGRRTHDLLIAPR